MCKIETWWNENIHAKATQFVIFYLPIFSLVGILSPQIFHEMVTEWQGENACYNSQL